MKTFAKTPQELVQLHSIHDLSKFDRLLDKSDRIALEIDISRYKHFTAGKFESVSYQEDAVKRALSESLGVWCGELAVGSGKTFVAAQVALHHLKRGQKVIYVCPSKTALGDVSNGIVSEFYKVLEFMGQKFTIGEINDPSDINDIYFFTPIPFVRLFKSEGTDRNLFSNLVEKSGLLIVDEAHHFPDEDDEDADLVYFNQIPAIAKKLFAPAKRVITLTGTHSRMDGKRVWKTPDFKFPLQSVVNEGRCPEIYWAQVYIGGVDFSNVKLAGNNYELGLTKADYDRYWDLVCGIMVKTWNRYGKPMCAFVRLVAEAELLAARFNEQSGLGDRGMVALTKNTSPKERRTIIEDIKSGRRMGYITVDVGAEALNIPPLEIVHLIRRSKSSNRNIQSIGRAVRMHPGKRRVLIVNYQVEKASVIRACMGFHDFATKAESDGERFVNGGPIVASKKMYRNLPESGFTLGEEERIISCMCNGGKRTWDEMYEQLTEFKDYFGHINTGEILKAARRGTDLETLKKK